MQRINAEQARILKAREEGALSNAEAEEAWQKADAELRTAVEDAQVEKVWGDRKVSQSKFPIPALAAAGAVAAFGQSARESVDDWSEEKRSAWNQFLYTNDARFIDEETRTLTTGTTGVPLPRQWYQEIIEKRDGFTWLPGLCFQVAPPTGVGAHDIANEATLPTAGVVAEAAATDNTESDPALNASLAVTPKDMLVNTSVSMRGLNSTNPLVGQYAQRALARAMAKQLEVYGLAGTGAGSPAQPKGIQESVRAAGRLVATSAAAFATNTANASSDLLHDLFGSIGEPYRVAPKFAFIGASTGVQLIRKLKDGTNRYIWKPGEWNADLRRWNPTELLGRPLFESANATYPTPGAAVVPWLVGGDFDYFFQYTWPDTGLVIDNITGRLQLKVKYSLHAVCDFVCVNTDAFMGLRFTS